MELQSGHPSMLNSGETLPGDANLCTHVQLLAPQIMRVRLNFTFCACIDIDTQIKGFEVIANQVPGRN